MQGYVRIILAAKKYIFIQTPYFLPTDAVFFALKTAAASGVDVRVMVPRKTDGWFVEWGSRSYLREAQEAGIVISLYDEAFLHSKMLVCDDSICTCGSTNIDFCSFENNFEANVFCYGEDLAVRMKQLFLHDASSSVPLSSLRERMQPGFFVRLGESLTRLLSPLL
jgi:cardiolipin synthase